MNERKRMKEKSLESESHWKCKETIAQTWKKDRQNKWPKRTCLFFLSIFIYILSLFTHFHLNFFVFRKWKIMFRFYFCFFHRSVDQEIMKAKIGKEKKNAKIVLGRWKTCTEVTCDYHKVSVRIRFSETRIFDEIVNIKTHCICYAHTSQWSYWVCCFASSSSQSLSTQRSLHFSSI